MAITHFTFGQAGSMAYGTQTPAMNTASLSSEGIVPSGSNQQTTATAGSDTSSPHVCRVASDTNVYVAFGSNPNALTGTGARLLVQAGHTEYFIVPASAKGAVVEV